MEQNDKERRIERIRKMEQCLDAAEAAIRRLSEALDNYSAARGDLLILADYYDNGLWKEDYEADEAGALPRDLKRGVLAQDTLYDLLAKDRDLLDRMANYSGAGQE